MCRSLLEEIASMISKYRNIKTVVDGITFASRKEANRYVELKFLEKQKVIKSLVLQPSFDLVAGIKYIADFCYIDTENPEKLTVEDVKGMRTEVYKIKLKLLLYFYHDIIFREI